MPAFALRAVGAPYIRSRTAFTSNCQFPSTFCISSIAEPPVVHILLTILPPLCGFHSAISLGMSNTLGGDISKAFEHFTQSVALFEKKGDLHSLSSSLAAKSTLASEPQMDTYISTGITSIEAIQMSERSLHIAQNIGWRSGQVFSLCTLIMNLLAESRYDRAMECLQNGAEIADQIQHRQWQTYIEIVSGVFYCELLAFEKAQVCFETALAMAQLSNSTHWIHVTCGFLADTLIKQTALADAQVLLEKSLLEDIPMITMGGRLVWAARAELAIANGDPRHALEIIDRMMQAASYSEKDVVVRLWMLRAEAHIAIVKIQADPTEQQISLKAAEEYLLVVLAETQALNYCSKIWQIHRSLAKLFRFQNKMNEYKTEQQTARKFVLELADFDQ